MLVDKSVVDKAWSDLLLVLLMDIDRLLLLFEKEVEDNLTVYIALLVVEEMEVE